MGSRDPLEKRVLDYTARLRRELSGDGAPGRRARRTPKALQAEPSHAPVVERLMRPRRRTSDEADVGGDVRAAISSRTRRTTVADLARRGVSNVAVVGMEQIERVVHDAVERALERRAVESVEARAEIEAEARRELTELLERHKRTVEEKTAAERRREELEATVGELLAERERAESALSTERARPAPSLSSGDVEMVQAALLELLDMFMDEQRQQLLAQGETEQALQGVEALEARLGQAFDGLLRRAKSENEELLERRIEKLNAALGETEDALRKIAAAKAIDPGMASVFDDVQGLSLADPDYAKKKELLTVVFAENLELQGRQLTPDEQRELEEARASLAAPAPLDDAEFGDLGFTDPTELEAQLTGSDLELVAY